MADTSQFLPLTSFEEFTHESLSDVSQQVVRRLSLATVEQTKRRRSSYRRFSRTFLHACRVADADGDFYSVGSDSEDYESLPGSPRKLDGVDADGAEVLSRARLGLLQVSLHADDSDNDVNHAGHDTEDLYDEEWHYGEDDDDDGGSCWSLEECYLFDSEKVAAALKRGAGQQELQDLVEEDMAANLENLMMECQHRTRIESNLAEPSPLMAGDLSGRMTPPQGAVDHGASAAVLAGRTTPPAACGGAQGTLPVDELTSRLSEVATKRRRSSAIQSRRISMATQSACAAHRRSLVQAMEKELVNYSDCHTREAVRQCASSSHRKYRQSLMKAADLLEMAGLGEEHGDDSPPDECLSPSQVKAQLQLVQQAVDGARRRHRQSIHHAVKQLQNQNVGRAVSQSPITGSCRERVTKIINAAFVPGECHSKTGLLKRPPHTLVALMHTRTSEKGLPVHCGPEEPPKRSAAMRRAKSERGGC